MQILAIRATTESLPLEDGALAVLGEIGDKVSGGASGVDAVAPNKTGCCCW